MLNSLKPRYREYKVGWWLKDGETADKRTRVRYTIVSETEKTYSKPIRNMVSTRNSLVIKTSFLYDYNIGDYFFTDYELNNKFTIKNRALFTNKINEQSLGTIKRNPNSYYALELV